MDVNLPPDLDRWLKSRADQIGVEPELLLHQLVDSYRTSGGEDEQPDHLDDPFGDGRPSDRFSGDRSRDMDTAVLESLLEEKLDEWIADDLAAAIDERVKETVDSELEAAVESRVGDAVESALDERLEPRVSETVAAELDASLDPRVEEAVEAATADLEDHLADRIDALEEERAEAIEDVRDRVIQVKKEADAKAPLDAHEATRDRLDDVGADLADLEERLASLSETVSVVSAETDRLDDHADSLETLEEDVSGVDERLNTLAWNVNKLRDYVDTATDLAPILEKAAQLDIDRAKCDRCDAAVEIGLLSEPACPHCSAGLTGVVESQSFFGKPRLLVADDAEQ